MKRALLIGMIVALAILSACNNENSTTSKPATEEQVQEIVQDFYNELSKLEELGNSSLAKFNEAIASYSVGNLTDKKLEKEINQFQRTATELSEKIGKVEISPSLPEDIYKLLDESLIAFQKAYSLKEAASKGAVSAEMSAEEFNELNRNADLSMLFGISKVNEARQAAGLIESDEDSDTIEE